jgi:hypothetical protein
MWAASFAVDRHHHRNSLTTISTSERACHSELLLKYEKYHMSTAGRNVVRAIPPFNGKHWYSTLRVPETPFAITFVLFLINDVINFNTYQKFDDDASSRLQGAHWWNVMIVRHLFFTFCTTLLRHTPGPNGKSQTGAWWLKMRALTQGRAFWGSGRHTTSLTGVIPKNWPKIDREWVLPSINEFQQYATSRKCKLRHTTTWNTSQFPSRRAELNVLSEIRIGEHLGGGQVPIKTPQRGTPWESSNSNRTSDTEPAPVNRFARAVTRTTWFAIGQSVKIQKIQHFFVLRKL